MMSSLPRGERETCKRPRRHLTFYFIALEPLARCYRLTARRHLAAGLMTLALAAATPLPVRAQGGVSETAVPLITKPAGGWRDELNPYTQFPDATVKAGVRSRVLLNADCSVPNRAPITWARADHGTVSVEEVMGPSCGHKSMPLAGVFYTPEPGFKGVDKLYILGFVSNGKIDRNFTIVVK